MKKDVIKLNEKKSEKTKEMVEIVNIGLNLSKKINREVLINKIAEQYEVSDTLKDIIESFMIESSKTANYIYYLTEKKEIIGEKFVPRTDVVIEEDEELYFSEEGMQEIDNILRNNYKLGEEVLMYIALNEQLSNQKQKFEARLKKSLLSNNSLHAMQKYYMEEKGLDISRKEIKDQLLELFNEYDMRYLIENDYITLV